jgi:DNA-binding CsgD family transcriptional regulator
MPSERMILRISPTVRDQIGCGESGWPVRCSAKVLESWRDLVDSAPPASEDRGLLMIEIDVCRTGWSPPQSIPESEPAEALAQKPAVLSASQPGKSAEVHISSHAIHDNVLRFLGSEFRRLRQVPYTDGSVLAFKERFHELSPRELDVLILLMQGRSCKEVAAKLEVGLATAAKHRARVLKKLCVKNSVELIHLLGAVFAELNQLPPR